MALRLSGLLGRGRVIAAQKSVLSISVRRYVVIALPDMGSHGLGWRIYVSWVDIPFV